MLCFEAMGTPIRILAASLALALPFGCGGKMAVVSLNGDDAGASTDGGAVSSDAATCGSPARDCLGGACVAGKCQPVTMASGPQFALIAWLTVDANNVYCAGYNEGTISKIPLRGGDLTVLAKGLSFPQGLLFDPTYVYFASAVSGGWGKVPIAGGATVQLGSAGASTGRLAFDGSNLLATAERGIFLVPVDGSAPSIWWTPNGDFAQEIFADGVNAYWLEMTSGLVRQRSLAGGEPITIATGQPLLKQVGAFRGRVYWSTGWQGSDHGSIQSAPVGGGPAQPLVSGEVYPETFAVDASGVYWTDPVDDRVMRLAPDATTPEIFAADQHGAFGLALDEVSVYWTVDLDDTTGALRRAAK